VALLQMRPLLLADYLVSYAIRFSEPAVVIASEARSLQATQSKCPKHKCCSLFKRQLNDDQY